MKRVLNVFPATVSLLATDSAKITGLLEMFNSVVSSDHITFQRVSVAGVEPKVFLYKIEAVGGRIWKQHVTFDDFANPLMTFEVADQWRLSEFSNQRNVRNALVALVGAYPTLEKIVYDYLAPQP